MKRSELKNIEAINILMERFRGLNEKERMVIVYRYGLISGSMLTLEKVGNRMNLIRERIRQIEFSALNKLEKCNIKK